MKNALVGGLAAALAVSGSLAGQATAAPGPVVTAVQEPPASADRGPLTKGAAWLAGQVPESGLLSVTYDFGSGPVSFPDEGLTIDAADALDQVGGRDALVTTMTDAVLARATEYTGGDSAIYANAAGKAAAFLLGQGRSGPAVDATVTRVRETVSTTPPITGRVVDQGGDDYASPIGQAFAVQALAASTSPELATALPFLLQQQCEAGYFRAGFTSDKEAVNQSCDAAPAGEKGSSVDTTALTILALQDLAGTDPVVATALDDAAAWLSTVQAGDGSFTTGGTSGAVNANSTGLAGRALSAEGRESDAAQAAVWLRLHQLVNAGTCVVFAAADDGAVVVDDLGRGNAASGAMDAIDTGVALRATAQALPALASAPGGELGQGRAQLRVPTQQVRAGSYQGVFVESSPGNTLCVTRGAESARRLAVGTEGRSVRVKLTPTTGRTVISVTDGYGRTLRAGIVGLAAARLNVSVPPAARRGTRMLVQVGRLAARESVTVRYRGRVVARGVAGSRGRYSVRVPVAGPVGRAAVVVTGRFADRRGSDVVVVRR